MRHLFNVLIVIISYIAIDWTYSPFLSKVDKKRVSTKQLFQQLSPISTTGFALVCFVVPFHCLDSLIGRLFIE